MTGFVYLRESHQTSLKVGEALQRAFAQCREDIAGKDEGYRLLSIFVRSRDEEAGVGKDGLFCLGEA